jgi:hypothetical protein
MVRGSGVVASLAMIVMSDDGASTRANSQLAV